MIINYHFFGKILIMDVKTVKVNVGKKTVKLNVGGTLFETTKNTLSLSLYFKTKFDNWNNEDNVMFIDRSPYIFKHILSLLRDPTYNYPSKYLEELTFYMINYDYVKPEDDMVKLFNEKFEQLTKEIKTINDNMQKVTNYLSSIKSDVDSITSDVDSITSDVDSIKSDVYSIYNILPKICDVDSCNNNMDCVKCKNCSTHCSCYIVYNGYNGCWTSNTFILTNSGYIKSFKLNIGDKVISPDGKESTIIEVIKFTASSKKMVKINDIWLTHGHPIKYNKDGTGEKWVSPRDIFDVTVENDVSLMNFRLDKHHEITISNTKFNIRDTELIVATLGRFTSTTNLID